LFKKEKFASDSTELWIDANLAQVMYICRSSLYT